MKHRILVAEDEAPIREGILTAFSDVGYEVVAASTRQQREGRRRAHDRLRRRLHGAVATDDGDHVGTVPGGLLRPRRELVGTARDFERRLDAAAPELGDGRLGHALATAAACGGIRQQQGAP